MNSWGNKMNDIAKIAIEEFVKRYAEHSKLTIKELYDLGLYPVPLSLPVPTSAEWLRCQGWQMIRDDLKGLYTTNTKGELCKRIMRELANE